MWAHWHTKHLPVVAVVNLSDVGCRPRVAFPVPTGAVRGKRLAGQAPDELAARPRPKVPAQPLRFLEGRNWLRGRRARSEGLGVWGFALG